MLKQTLYSFVFILGFVMTSSTKAQALSYNFGKQGCGDCDWFVVVDGVMGGLSTGNLKVNDNSLILSGRISLQNNGGFSSIRIPYQKLDLRPYKEVTIRYRSLGQSFGFTLNKHRRFWLPRFKTILPITNGEWSSVTLPFSEFKKMRFDEVLSGGPSERELGQMIRLGFISNDKKATEFELELDYLKFE